MKHLTIKQKKIIDKAINILKNGGFIVQEPYEIEPSIISHILIGSRHREFLHTHYNVNIIFKIPVGEKWLKL